MKETFFKKNSDLTINHEMKLAFDEILIVTKMEISKKNSNLLRDIGIKHCFYKSIEDRFPIHFTVWKLTVRMSKKFCL